MKTIASLSAVAFALGLAALATPANARQAIPSTDLNVRSGPGTQYEVRGTLDAGESVWVSDCSGGWCRVNAGGLSGYASASYLDAGYRAAPNPVIVPRIYLGFGNNYHRPHGWYPRHRWNN